jgi:hypothetical protein
MTINDRIWLRVWSTRGGARYSWWHLAALRTRRPASNCHTCTYRIKPQACTRRRSSIQLRQTTSESSKLETTPSIKPSCLRSCSAESGYAPLTTTSCTRPTTSSHRAVKRAVWAAQRPVYSDIATRRLLHSIVNQAKSRFNIFLNILRSSYISGCLSIYFRHV